MVFFTLKVFGILETYSGVRDFYPRSASHRVNTGICVCFYRLYSRRVRRARRRARLVGRGRRASPASVVPRAPLPLEARSRVDNAATVTALRPDTYQSIATATDSTMRALRVAGDIRFENRGLRGALEDTPIRVRIHSQLPADRVPDILWDDRHTARLSIEAHQLVAVEAPEQSIEL